jgi:hypothetical protein
MHDAFLCTRATKEGKNVKPTIVIPSKRHSAAVFIVDQPTNNQRPTTGRLTIEELNYSCNRAWRRGRLSNNLVEVWQNLAPFGGRLIDATVEALLTKVLNRQSSGSR